MANLTFIDLQNECFAHLGLDSADATNQANVQRWLNYVQQDICSRWPWTFMLSRESIVTVPDYLTGTASVNAGSTTVTGTTTVWTTAQGDGTYFIQFSTANDWYKVTARASNTSITIEQPYQQTANATNVTYTLRKFFYSLSSSADEVIDCRNWNTPVKLVQVDLRFIDDLQPNPQSTNSSYGYMMFGVDASGNQVFSPYPFPSDARLFEFRTKKRPTDMSISTDKPSVPNKYAHIVSWGAISVGFAYLRKFQEAQSWDTKLEQRISEMKKEYRASEDFAPVLRSIDSVQRSKWIQMPNSYPVITGG